MLEHFLQKAVNQSDAAYPKQMFVINKLVQAKINKVTTGSWCVELRISDALTGDILQMIKAFFPFFASANSTVCGVLSRSSGSKLTQH